MLEGLISVLKAAKGNRAAECEAFAQWASAAHFHKLSKDDREVLADHFDGAGYSKGVVGNIVRIGVALNSADPGERALKIGRAHV